MKNILKRIFAVILTLSLITGTVFFAHAEEPNVMLSKYEINRLKKDTPITTYEEKVSYVKEIFKACGMKESLVECLGEEKIEMFSAADVVYGSRAYQIKTSKGIIKTVNQDTFNRLSSNTRSITSDGDTETIEDAIIVSVLWIRGNDNITYNLTASFEWLGNKPTMRLKDTMTVTAGLGSIVSGTQMAIQEYNKLLTGEIVRNGYYVEYQGEDSSDEYKGQGCDCTFLINLPNTGKNITHLISYNIRTDERYFTVYALYHHKFITVETSISASTSGPGISVGPTWAHSVYSLQIGTGGSV